MKAVWKPLERNLLIAQYKIGSKVSEGGGGGGGENVEDDRQPGCPKDASIDFNVKVVHILVLCDRGETCTA